MSSEKIILKESDFWNSPKFFTELSPEINRKIDQQDVIISKGDANYRRFFEDRKIPYNISPRHLTNYLPCPTYCIRTLKSEIQLGLSQNQVNKLKSTQPDWLYNGKNAVIQKIN